MGGPRALATAALYLVLLSNGLPRPKIRLKKFGFSSKPIPTNIAKKLPSQRCSKPLFIAFFNFSHKWPTFAFTDESGYTLGFRRRIAHNGTHGETGGLPFCEHSVALRCQRNTLYSATLLYTYISRFSVNPQHQQKRIIRQSYRRNSVPNHFSSRFSTSRTNGPRSLSRAKAGTHRLCSKESHTTAHTPKQGTFRMGVVSLPSERSARSRTSPGRVSERQTLPLLSLGRRCSRRTQRACGTAMRLCASLSRRRRGPAGLRCSVCNLVMLLFFHSARRAFHTCKRGCGITTLGVLRVLSKRWAAACQNSSFAVF